VNPRAFAITALIAVSLVGGVVYALQRNQTAAPAEVSSDVAPTPTPSEEASAEPSAAASSSTEVSEEGITDIQAVEIRDFTFSPATITIVRGTTLSWTNADDVAHDVATVSGPERITSPLLGQGKSFSFTFNQPGTYEYECTLHPWMKGTVVVTE
jgi:amicyanin